MATLYGQLAGRTSLRDLVFSQNRQAHKLYHLGHSRVRRSILADACIRLTLPRGRAAFPEVLRRVHFRDPETGKE